MKINRNNLLQNVTFKTNSTIVSNAVFAYNYQLFKFEILVISFYIIVNIY